MEKQRWEESERRRKEVRRSERRKREKKEDAGALKGRKICGSRGSKSDLAKAAGAEPCRQMRDEKLRDVVARSTFPSQNVITKHTNVGPLLEVAMSKKCTPLWLEAHVQVKMYKAPHHM